MSLINQKKNQHLLWRAGFGPAVSQLHDLSLLSPKQLYKDLLKSSIKEPVSLNIAGNNLQEMEMMDAVPRNQLSAEERKKIQQQNREGIKDLNLSWLKSMVNSEAQLREKMAFFWHGHFACRNLNVRFQQGLLNVIRKNALENFGTLLKEISKTPAMLNFLNNQQNRKGHPNENFAREVMELFTLGRGNYTEQDVKEAARAFTGWGFNLKGEFVFRKNQHDNGNKMVLGKTGILSGDDVLDILLQQKQTAKFISRKIYEFFVNDQADDQKINLLAERFYKNNYDIAGLMEDIFTSDWFYDEKNIGAKIKSPVELLAGIQRMLPMELENEGSLIVLQRILGQMLFYPPNVAGWPGGKTWIDSSTLMMRMRIPQLISDNDELNVKPKDDDDQMMGRKDEPNKVITTKRSKGAKPINAKVEWKTYISNFEKTPKEKLLKEMTEVLLQTNKGVSEAVINEYVNKNSREDFIKTATIQIMSTPEYQLC